MCSYDVLAGHVTAALGRFLVLNEERRNTHLVVKMYSVSYVLHVTITVVGVNQHGQLAGINDLPHRSTLLAEARQVNIRNGIARPINGKAADLVCLESCAFDQFRR